jgi:hypothetical protein
MTRNQVSELWIKSEGKLQVRWISGFIYCLFHIRLIAHIYFMRKETVKVNRRFERNVAVCSVTVLITKFHQTVHHI